MPLPFVATLVAAALTPRHSGAIAQRQAPLDEKRVPQLESTNEDLERQPVAAWAELQPARARTIEVDQDTYRRGEVHLARISQEAQLRCRIRNLRECHVGWGGTVHSTHHET